MGNVINVEFGKDRLESEMMTGTDMVSGPTFDDIYDDSWNEPVDNRKCCQYHKKYKDPVEPFRSKEHIQKVANYLKRTGIYAMRNWLLFLFGINTGLRCSDIVVRQFRDVFDANGFVKDYFVVKETKTGKGRKIYINNLLRSALEEYVASIGDYSMDDYIFYSRKTVEPHMTVEAIRLILVKAVDATINKEIREYNQAVKANGGKDANGNPVKLKREFHVGTHTMRKTFATFALNSTSQLRESNPLIPEPLAVVQSFLNHSSTKDTLRYLGITGEIEESVTLDVGNVYGNL